MRWQGPQLQEIQIHALHIIGNLISVMPQHFYDIGAHQVLVLFLQNYSDKKRRLSALKALLDASPYELFKADFNQFGLVESLIDIVSNSQADGTLYLRELSFTILSNIC